MTAARGAGFWRAGVLLLPLACARTNPSTTSPSEAAPREAPKSESVGPSGAEEASTVVAVESPPRSDDQVPSFGVASVLGRRWFHWVCVRSPPDPPTTPATQEEPKKPTNLGTKLDALGTPPEAPRPPAREVKDWYVPTCNYMSVPISIHHQDGPDPLWVACYQQRKACDASLDDAALRRVPKRAEVVIDRRGEAQSVAIYQNGKLLDDDELEAAVACFFAMLPGEIAWQLERCSP